LKKLTIIKTLKNIVIILVIIVAFNASCITSKGALRTYLFTHGHPIIAFVTPISSGKFQGSISQMIVSNKNIHIYTVDIPIEEKDKIKCIRNYMVEKKGFFYFVHYFSRNY
jgi:hypothetical protein